MSQQSANGGIDWMSIATKMFMNKLNNQTAHQRHSGGTRTLPYSSPSPSRVKSFMHKTKPTNQESPVPVSLPPDCVATIKQFEALRIHLLRQLVIYQSQLLALKMPPLPGQLTKPPHDTVQTNEKVTQRKLSKNKNKNASTKAKSGNKETKKWEKIQGPSHLLKSQNKRRGQAAQKLKKSTKKATKRKLDDVQTSVSDNHTDTNFRNTNKKPYQSHQACLRDYSSSTDSFYSLKNQKYNNYSCNCLKGVEMPNKNSPIMDSSSGKYTNTMVKSLAKGKTPNVHKKVSAFVVESPTTDDAQSSL